jgi:phosphopantothenate---cysteine ligase (CTP)
MNLLVTAGNTQVYIDKVRCLTNIFTGRTGAAIALEAYRRGHTVTLFTSHPDTVEKLKTESAPAQDRWRMFQYQTLADLDRLMQVELTKSKYDVVVHCAAVSDYLSAGIFAPAPGTSFQQEANTWYADPGKSPALVERGAGKVKSDEPELWLRLVRAPKLVDKVRTDWGFHGTLVKFKLEVGLTDDQLLTVAEKSRVHSQADFMVANLLEKATAAASVYLGPLEKGYIKLARTELPATLMNTLENLRR